MTWTQLQPLCHGDSVSYWRKDGEKTVEKTVYRFIVSFSRVLGYLIIGTCIELHTHIIFNIVSYNIHSSVHTCFDVCWIHFFVEIWETAQLDAGLDFFGKFAEWENSSPRNPFELRSGGSGCWKATCEATKGMTFSMGGRLNHPQLPDFLGEGDRAVAELPSQEVDHRGRSFRKIRLLDDL